MTSNSPQRPQYPSYFGPEMQLWQGQPSWVALLLDLPKAFKDYWIIGAPFYCLYRYFQLRNLEYTLTSKRLIIRYGIYGFFRHLEIPIEIFKIIEVDISSPLVYRFFGVSNLLLRTMEVEHVSLSLLALPQATRLATMLRDLAIQAQIETGNRPIWRIGTGGNFE